MTQLRKWFDRQFELGLPPDAFPDLVERLRGTPARLEDRLRDIPGTTLTTRPSHGWSVQEHAGHLLDLEPLWRGRFEDLMTGKDELRPADLQNTRTHEANHNASRLADLLLEFRGVRLDWVGKLDELSDDRLTNTARHPRLRQPMTVVDLCFFVAEHDDHHLAAMTRLLRAGRGAS